MSLLIIVESKDEIAVVCEGVDQFLITVDTGLTLSLLSASTDS